LFEKLLKSITNYEEIDQRSRSKSMKLGTNILEVIQKEWTDRGGNKYFRLTPGDSTRSQAFLVQVPFPIS
jgi:hypothetical protein